MCVQAHSRHPPLPIPIECAPLKGWGGWLVGRWVGSDRMGRGERREVVVGGGGGGERGRDRA